MAPPPLPIEAVSKRRIHQKWREGGGVTEAPDSKVPEPPANAQAGLAAPNDTPDTDTPSRPGLINHKYIVVHTFY